jgi:DNA-binding transcriptional ArsR family regulator
MEPPRPRQGNATAKAVSNPKRTAATSNRFGELNSFVDCSMADLTRAEALTWLVLWRDTKNGTVRTSARDIARRIGASREAVTTALAKLRKVGLLRLVHQGGMAGGVSVYHVEPLAKPTG